MSIDMYLGESQLQASSAKTMTQEDIQAYEELESSLSDFEASTDLLKGKAYDSARAYAEQVLRPLAVGGKLLSEAVGQAVSRFPEAYVEQVCAESLKESELTAQIQQLDTDITAAQTTQAAFSLLGSVALAAQCQFIIDTATQARQILQEKLDKLRAFNASSPQIFSEIESLKSLVDTGLSQLSSGWDASKGVYVLPANLSWASQLMLMSPMTPPQLDPQEQAFVNNLMNQYGFNEETARLILKLKKKIDEKYPDKTQQERDYLLNRALGAPIYDGFNWDQTAGDLEGDSPQEFYKNMGLTDAEAQLLYYEIKKQNDFSALDPGDTVNPAADKARYAERLKLYKSTHDTSGMSEAEIEAAFLQDWKDQNERYADKTDFAHQSITTATHLNDSWGLPRIWYGGKKNVEEVSGWRGDATTDAEAKPSMGNADYKADLDAVNITTIMRERNISYVEASNYYYNHLEDNPNPNTSQQTRAELFLQSTDMEHVKDELYAMVPDKTVPASNRDGYRFVSRTEEEKRAYLKEHYPDSYNFLRSLEERDGQMGNYAESE